MGAGVAATAATAHPLGASRRWAALAALGLLVVAVVGAVFAVSGDLLHWLLAPVLMLVLVLAGWTALTHRGLVRWFGVGLAAASVVGLVALVLTADVRGIELVLTVVAAAVSLALSRYALEPVLRTIAAEEQRFQPVGPARRAVLVVNPKSGGGKAERAHLADAARARGIHCIELHPGDDLRTIVIDAIDEQTDVIGVAGGDGSQALVASIAAERGLAMVCIAAGTRNHFARDLGLDRNDVLAGLDAFGDDALERKVDLGFINDRCFVNNVSLGVYAQVVQSPEYRDAKARTTASMLGEVFGPGAPPLGLRFHGPDGKVHDRAQIIEVSNNPYDLVHLDAFGTRARLDGGVLGIDAIELAGATDVATLVALEAVGRIKEFRGLLSFESPEFTVDADHPVAVAVDGEALTMEPPLTFRSHPGVVRVRTPASATCEPLAEVRPHSWWWSVTTLVGVAVGRVAPRKARRRERAAAG